MAKQPQKAGSNIVKGDKKKEKRKESYAIYICKLIKQLHIDIIISDKAMTITQDNLFSRKKNNIH